MRSELEQVLPLLRAGDTESVGAALGLLQNAVYSFSMKVCGHREDAEDTMQEVLMRSLPHLGRLENGRALAVWLYTVTRNRCWRMRRKGADAGRRSFSLDALLPDEVERERLLAASGESPEAAAARGERGEQLQRAVLRLPPPLRVVLVLHDMEELETAEIAKVLGLQAGTVRVRLHRARLAVRKLLAEGPGSGRPAGAARGPCSRATCRSLFAELSEYMDGRLEPRRCAEMERHIEACPTCVAFLRDLRRAIDRCKSLETPCEAGLAERLRVLLVQEYRRLLEAGRAPAASAH